ncbi:transposase [Salinisphaera hydrothermalis C27AD]
MFARRIVGWRAPSAPNTSLALDALDALEQAIHDRQPHKGLIRHTDRGIQCLSIRYSERLADIGITPSVGRVGSSYDNSLAGTVIGLFKTEVIRRRGPRPSSRRWTASPGSVISICSVPLATSSQPRPKQTLMPHWPTPPRQRDSNP